VSRRVQLQHPSAGDHHALPGTIGLHQFAFPPSSAQKRLFDLFQRFRKLRLEQLTGNAAHRFLVGKAVKPFRAVAPLHNAAVHVPHKYLRQIKCGRLFIQSLIRLLERRLDPFLVLDVGASAGPPLDGSVGFWNRQSTDPLPAVLSISPSNPVLPFVRGVATGGLLPRVQPPPLIFRVNQLSPTPPTHRFERQTRVGHPARVDVLDKPVRSRHPGHIRESLDQSPVILFTPCKRFHGLLFPRRHPPPRVPKPVTFRSRTRPVRSKWAESATGLSEKKRKASPAGTIQLRSPGERGIPGN